MSKISIIISVIKGFIIVIYRITRYGLGEAERLNKQDWKKIKETVKEKVENLNKESNGNLDNR